MIVFKTKSIIYQLQLDNFTQGLFYKILTLRFFFFQLNNIRKSVWAFFLDNPFLNLKKLLYSSNNSCYSYSLIDSIIIATGHLMYL